MKKPEKIEPQKIIGFKGRGNGSKCNHRDAVLYALGLGMRHQEHLSYLNQASLNFKIFPTYATCLHQTDILTPLIECPGIPDFNPLMILYAEHKLIIEKPIKPGMQLETTSQLVNVQDKGKITVFTVRLDTHEKNGMVVFRNEFSLIVRGMGGTGYKGKPGHQFQRGKVQRQIEIKTLPNQAIIYRLSGDPNPLHVDVNTAALQKFQKPILHGLASYGTICRAIVQQLCAGNPDVVRVFHARFVSHVFPGETIIVGLWGNKSGWGFSARTKERGKEVVIGYIQTEGIGSL